MPDIAQHLLGGRTDIQGLEGAAQGGGQLRRIVAGVIGGGEAGHGECENVRSRTPEFVHRAGRHQQRVGRIQTPGHADDDLRLADRAQPLLQPVHLDAVCLVAVLGQPAGIVGDEREAVDLATQTDVAVRRVEGEIDDRATVGVQESFGAVVEAVLPHPLLAQQVEVDVGDAPRRIRREALGRGQQSPVLVDRCLAVPRQIGGRFARPARRIDVGRQIAGRRAAAEQLAVVGASDRDGGARDIHQYRGATHGGQRARWQRHPHVFADLDREAEIGQIDGPEDDARAEGHGVGVLDPRQGDQRLVVRPPRCLGEMPLLVELPVVGQVALRHHAQHASAMQHDSAVVEPVAVAQRSSHHDRRQQIGGGCA